MKVILAQPRGFCAGVVRAVRRLEVHGVDVLEMDIRLTAPDAHGLATWVVNHENCL